MNRLSKRLSKSKSKTASAPAEATNGRSKTLNKDRRSSRNLSKALEVQKTPNFEAAIEQVSKAYVSTLPFFWGCHIHQRTNL